MEKRELQIGDIIQLHPGHKFECMFVVVTEPKEWGCQGYLVSPVNFEATRFKGVAYIRPRFDEFEYVGHAAWIRE